jgi:hypothetical protein
MSPEAGDDGPRTAARQGFAFTAAALVVVFLAALGAQFADGGSDMGTVWHMRWRVYADTANREVPVAYRYADDRFERMTEPIGAPGYLWGVSHTGNAELYRLLAAVGTIPASAWRDCDAASVTDCRSVIRTAPGVSIPSPFPGVCGPVVFTVERAADWGAGPTARVRRVASTELTCRG